MSVRKVLVACLVLIALAALSYVRSRERVGEGQAPWWLAGIFLGIGAVYVAARVLRSRRDD